MDSHDSVPTTDEHHRDILNYYHSTDIDYRWFWDLRQSMAMHYGYWDETTPNQPAALRRLNQILASRVGIHSTDRVLDAGCGVGGSSVFLAKEYGCQVTGITLVPEQAETAKANAERMGVSSYTHFLAQDYVATNFPDSSFDVVWAIESVCHTVDKRQFIREAFRLLRPGGRLIVSDYFFTRDALTRPERQLLRPWLAGWSLPNLASRQHFSADLKQTGFSDIDSTDETQHILPSSRRLFLYSLPGIPVGYVAQWLGLRSKIQTGNFLASHYQYRALQKKIWHYCIFTASRH